MKKLSILFIAVISISSGAFSQTEKLSLQDAIRIGLANNYSIMIAENVQAANKYARNVGNAGMLPTVSLNGGLGYSNTNVRQELSNGNNISSDGAVSTTYNAAIQLNWVLFDGLKMFATYDKLTAIKKQTEFKTKFEMEMLVSTIMQNYFAVFRFQQVKSSIIENISIGEERVTIAQKKLDVGTGSKSELLQAKIDLNTLRSQLFDQQVLLNEAKINLNQMLSRDPAIEFEVTDSIQLGSLLDMAEVRSSALNNNTQLQISNLDISINKFARREVNSLRFPKISFNAGYSYNRAQNQAGFLLLNQNFGFTTGLSLTYNIFDSWRVNTQYKLATISMQNAGYNFDWMKIQTDAQIVNAYNKYQVYTNQSELQKESVAMAKENATLSLERFKQGISNFLELREAQKSYVDAVTSYTTSLYNAKLQEIELLRLKGELVK